jgi:hypothetical protein
VDLALSDPTYRPSPAPGFFERVARRFLCDVRDIPFLRLSAFLTVVVGGSGVALYVPRFFSWWFAGAHLALVVYFVGPFILMLHNTSHRKLFNKRWRWLNNYIPWILGPFFGETPETYFGHHVGMHHAENNLKGDLSSTMGFQRDSFVDFLRYFLRFFFGVFFELTVYFARLGRRSLMWRCAVGEILFYAVVGALLWHDWRATLVVFVLPFLIARFGMMAGNWGQHAFIDRTAPENNYRNSITCIDCVYNRRCFNDGYHIGHHLKQTRHWTEMPEDFRRNVETYGAEEANVFRGIDNFGIWARLMLKRYDSLARHFVDLGPTKRTHGEIVALLRSRTARIDV